MEKRVPFCPSSLSSLRVHLHYVTQTYNIGGMDGYELQ